MTKSMTEQTFKSLIDTYGANQGRWPSNARASATAFIQGNPEQASQILHPARELEALLDTQSKPDIAPHVLMARIQKQAKITPQDPEALAPLPANDTATTDTVSMPGLRAITAMLLIAIGIGFGAGNIFTANEPETTTEVLLAMVDDAQYTIDDFYLNTEQKDGE